MIIINRQIAIIFGLISFALVFIVWHFYKKHNDAIANSILPDLEAREPVNVILSLISYSILTWICLLIFLTFIVPNFEDWFGAALTDSGIAFGLSLFIVGLAVYWIYCGLARAWKKAIKLRDDEYVQCLVMGCIIFCLGSFLSKDGGAEAQAAMHMMGLQTLAILLGKYIWLDGIIILRRGKKELQKLKHLLKQGALRSALFPIQENQLIRGVAWAILFVFLIGLTLQKDWFLSAELGTTVGGYTGLFALCIFLQLKENQRVKKAQEAKKAKQQK